MSCGLCFVDMFNEKLKMFKNVLINTDVTVLFKVSS